MHRGDQKLLIYKLHLRKKEMIPERQFDKLEGIQNK